MSGIRSVSGGVAADQGSGIRRQESDQFAAALPPIRYQESGDRDQIGLRRRCRRRKIHEAGKMPTLPECIGWGERSDAQHLACVKRKPLQGSGIRRQEPRNTDTREKEIQTFRVFRAFRG
ncbi:MAG: hypothetical protein LBM17_01115 [Candidatus Accumulibacter sp.]|nr:hypothetical protein [Accumulibacter sp.]